MKNANKFLIPALVFSILVIPALSLAQTPTKLIPCGRAGQTECHFNDLITLINNVIKFTFVYLAIPIATIMFIYAGVTLVTSGGSTEARSKAKSIFTNTAIGLIFMAASWLIINIILTTLGYNDTGDWFGFRGKV